ncbi:hypothetical protein GCM10009733_051480 [Nonomuraea maheshkhaliensis]|uniref:Uncharacterized protein n=1 Tax=Nonomuraea maheshkhaliensis TaxID=419590 RepID=A0ABP4RE24_9ACTN
MGEGREVVASVRSPMEGFSSDDTTSEDASAGTSDCASGEATGDASGEASGDASGGTSAVELLLGGLAPG